MFCKYKSDSLKNTCFCKKITLKAASELTENALRQNYFKIYLDSLFCICYIIDRQKEKTQPNAEIRLSSVHHKMLDVVVKVYLMLHNLSRNSI